MTAGVIDDEVVRRHLGALDRAVVHLARHQGLPVTGLEIDQDRRWSVERGLLVCAQNALDVARLHRFLNQHLADFTTYSDQVREYCSQHASGE